MNGKFVISLDFELLWGIRDNPANQINKSSIENVWSVLPKMLQLFDEYDVKVTIATVGFLFAENKKEVMHFIPKNLPSYSDENLSPYNDLFDLPEDANEINHSIQFAKKLLDESKKYSTIEIGTHTFSHFYCLDPFIDEESFEDDLKSAIRIAKVNSIDISTIIFPRNQFNEEFKDILVRNGIIGYRGLEPLKIYDTTTDKLNSKKNKGLRMLDSYLPIFPHSIYNLEKLREDHIVNIPSSRFLRPFFRKLSFLEGLKINRIKKGMTKAAKEHKLYHLWWHPHNFGINMEENLNNLNQILKHYQKLQKKYNFESETMKSLSQKLLKYE